MSENQGASQAEGTKAPRSALRWVLLPVVVIWRILLLPLTVFKFISGGGIKWFWNSFGSFIVGSYKRDETGAVRYLRCVSYPRESIHLHPLIWGGLVLAAIEIAIGRQPAWVGVVYVCLGFFTVATVVWDFPFRRFIGIIALTIPLLILADIGVALGSALWTGWISGAWNDWMLKYCPAGVRWFLEGHFLNRGLLRPIGDGITWLSPTLSPGMLLLLSILCLIFWLWDVVQAWLYHRVQIDRDEVVQYRFMESETREPVYMRRFTRKVGDVLEAIFGFADLEITLAKGSLAFNNVFGLTWWLAAPLNELITPGSVTDEERAAAGVAADEADGVRTPDEEAHDHDGENGGHV